MLHLRVIAPTDLRDPVIDLLTGNPGVTHLVVHRDAAREPEGDTITADIARESANDVVDAARGESERHNDGRRSRAVGLPARPDSMTRNAAVRPL
jgi:hypothetical protein